MNTVQKLRLPLLRVVLLASAASACALSSASAFEQAAPQGTGYAISVPEPSVRYPLPVSENYRNQTGKNAAGADVRGYDDRDNPIIEILSGFNRIWSLGDEKWADGGANGDGPADFSKAHIVDPAVWAENMRYVLSVTGKNRSEAAAFDAYMNDRRSQGYSVIDGMGPLAAWYREGAGATTTIAHTPQDFNVDDVIARKEDDKGTEAGSPDSQLKDFVAFMKLMRGPEGSTSPAKYFYSSPRPWRMTDTGEVKETGTEAIGDRTFEAYESDVGVIVPALKYVRENRGRPKDGAFPSGHTNAAYLAAIAYAYAVPERYAELLTRASELGESRVVAGMHSPLDVIGGRISATAMAAAMLQNPKISDAAKAAHKELNSYFTGKTGNGQSLHDFAHSADLASDRFADAKANKATYRQHMTFSFSRNAAAGDLAMVVPKGAEVLLETRLPYLDADQRRAVLFSTGVESGYPLFDDSNGWGRINLVAAASGYGAFNGDVHVNMDGAAGGFNAADRWDNDISGPGLLSKTGSGTLTISGDNSYSGGTIVKDGGIIATSETALGTGNVLVEGGTLGADDLKIGGDLTLSGGTLKTGSTGIEVRGKATIAGGALQVALEDKAAKAGTVIKVISASGLTGKFASIEVAGAKFRPVYSDSGLTLEIE